MQRKARAELVRAAIEADRLKAEAENAKAEAEQASLKTEELAKADAAAKAAAEAKVAAEANAKAAAAEATKLQAVEKGRLEALRKTRVKNAAVLALWEEANHDAIRLVATRDKSVTVNHKGVSLTANYQDLPEWLLIAAQAKHKEDGETTGVIREVDGKLHDLRASPVGWITLPTAEVIQIVEDGYLLVDVKSLNDPYAQTKVFKLKHNGLTRILNTGDRIQMMAKSVGTHTYANKAGEALTVPVYDPGMPVGPLRERVVTMAGRPATAFKGAAPSPDEPTGNGSGFFISEDGLFISNAHVVADSTRIEVRTVAGKKRATVLQMDKDKDLALLRVSVEKGSVPALNISTNKVSLGAQVFTIGYPMVELQGSRPKFTDGKVSSLAGIRDDPDQMQISVPVQPGNSGGPLADMNGDIVGVIVGRMNDLKVIKIAGSVPQNVNYAVKGATLLRFLNENKALLPNLKFGRTPQRTQEEAIQVVEKASGLVLIYR